MPRRKIFFTPLRFSFAKPSFRITTSIYVFIQKIRAYIVFLLFLLLFVFLEIFLHGEKREVVRGRRREYFTLDLK